MVFVDVIYVSVATGANSSNSTILLLISMRKVLCRFRCRSAQTSDTKRFFGCFSDIPGTAVKIYTSTLGYPWFHSGTSLYDITRYLV